MSERNERPKSARIRFTLPTTPEEPSEFLKILDSLSEKRSQSSKTEGESGGNFARTSNVPLPIRSHISLSRKNRAISTPNVSNHLSIDIEESKIGAYIMGSVLGHGSQATVCKAIDTRTGTFVAIKEIVIENKTPQSQIKTISEEIALLKQLDHPNIIKYITALRRQQRIYVVFEFIENGSLKDILLNFGVFTESLASIYVKQILQGLEYLHERNIVHRDIKGANVLITKEGICKLGDFGLATNEKQISISKLAVGTPYWMAPEFVSGKVDRVTTSSDIWSLGATVVELITGNPPLHELSPMVATFQLIEGNVVPIPDGISKQLQSFLKNCFALEPTQRATAAELLRHPWIKGSVNTAIDRKAKSVKELMRELRSNRTNLEKPPKNACILPPIKQTLMNKSEIASHGTNQPSLQFLGEEEEEEEEEDIDSLSKEELKEKYRQLKARTTELKEITKKLEKELVITNQTESSSKWTIDKRKQRNETVCLQQTNSHLREQLQFLERNMNISDKERAALIFQSLHWGKFPDSHKGILKIRKRPASKFVKRYVVLQDNFFLIYKENTSHSDDPLDVVWLVDVVVNTMASPINCFELKTRNRRINICAASSQIMEKWMKKISFPKLWFDVAEFTPQIRSSQLPVKTSSSLL